MYSSYYSDTRGVTISLFISLMTLPKAFQRHLHLQMWMIGKKLFVVRWNQFYPTEHGSSLIDYMDANMWVASGCSKRSLGLIVLLISTRLGLWLKVIPRKNEDFFDTYSHIARLTTIGVLLSLVASHCLLVHQMDVKRAFLNGELEEEIYTSQSYGFLEKGHEDNVYKIQKSLYDLKQKPKQWHEKFDMTLILVGFSVNEVDRCVYCCHGGG
jgi:hypothetical protein